MPLPNYRDGSLVNLISSVAGACGHRLKARELAQLPSKRLQNKRIVLLIADGLGYEFLKAHRGFLWNNTRGKITSVFPSTTAAAITTIRTGAAPAEHGLTGWFMHAKELGAVVKPLPGGVRGGGPIDVSALFTVQPFYPKLKRKAFIVAPEDVTGSQYTRYHSRGAKMLIYRSTAGFFNQLKTALRSQSCFVYAYWPAIDYYCHHLGTRDKRTISLLRMFEKSLQRLLSQLKDTTVIVTGDHGLIDVDRKHILNLDDHPKLAETLTLPFAGEARALYCYVHPAKDKEFRRYVRTHLSHACRLYPSSKLLPWYGLGKRNPKLTDRVGDYILVMKENYVLRDRLPTELPHYHRASHGGISKEEMHIPLIVFGAKD
jgi:hypothetical protein